MEIVSLCPLRVAGRAYTPALFAHAYLVVCKATFLLAPSVSILHDTQEDLNEDDNHWDDHPQRSLYAASDFAPLKRGADVVLVGHAFSPNGAPVRSFITRLCVAELDKAIEVFADRIYTPHGELRDGQRVSRVRLRYERAAGGPGTNNPVGMRHDVKDAFGAIALPNLQPAGRHVTKPEDLVEPIGYGPIAPNWPSRLARLGPLASGFSPSRWYDAPLPEGLDPSFFNVAPPDQEIHELRADERLVLEGLHATHTRLVTNLPGLRPRAIVERASGKREDIRLVADTLWIDTTRGICTVVWRGRIALTHPHEPGQVYVAMEGPGVSATFPVAAANAMFNAPISDDDPDGSVTMTSDQFQPDKPSVIMPFTGSVSLPERGPIAPVPRESGVFPADRTADLDDDVTFVGLDSPAPNPLPFRPAPSLSMPFSAPPKPPLKSSPSSAGLPFTAPPNPPAPRPAPNTDLPFATPWSSQPPPVAPPPVFPKQDLPFVSPNPSFTAPPAVAPPVAPPAMVPKPLATLGRPPEPAYTPAPVSAPAPAPVSAPASASVSASAPASASASASASAPASAQPSAPAMIGPLATPEMVARHAPPPPPPPPEPEPAAAPPPPQAAPPPPLPLDAYPIERCGQITASIARRRDFRAEILEAEELSLSLWTDLERHYQDVIQAEIERGKTRSLKAFDAAYVARLEEERGPIMPVEYARLVVASERGQAARALEAAGLPRGSMMRIERVFLARSLEDPRFGEKIRRAVDAEREA